MNESIYVGGDYRMWVCAGCGATEPDECYCLPGEGLYEELPESWELG